MIWQPLTCSGMSCHFPWIRAARTSRRMRTSRPRRTTGKVLSLIRRRTVQMLTCKISATSSAVSSGAGREARDRGSGITTSLIREAACPRGRHGGREAVPTQGAPDYQPAALPQGRSMVLAPADNKRMIYLQFAPAHERRPRLISGACSARRSTSSAYWETGRGGRGYTDR